MAHPAPDHEFDELVRLLGLTPAAVEARLAAVGLTADDLGRLAAVEPHLRVTIGPALDALYTRLLSHQEFVALLGSEAQIARLKAALRRDRRAQRRALRRAPQRGRRRRLGDGHHDLDR